jgi:glycosyltransferase involved in cell wall biosynthesis
VYLSLSCLPRQEWFGGRGSAAALAFAQYAWLERRIARAADVVVVASELHAREMRRYEFLPGLRAEVMHPVHAGPPAAPRAGSGGPLRLLAAGRLVAGKGYGRLVDMMAQLRDVDCRLVIAGEGPEAPALAAQAATLGLDGRIALAGAGPSIDALLAEADLFLHPSRYESFGIAVFEAQRAGVPPLCDAGAVAGYREIVSDGVDGLLVDFGDPARAAAAVRTLALDPARRRAMSEAAARSAAVRAAQDHARRFRTLIDRLLGAPAPA